MTDPAELNADRPQILIVEDSPTQAQQLRHVLERHHYQVLAAAHGREALEILKERQPALVISDILMPEMDGYELCTRIKLGERSKDIPVILLTSLSKSEDVLEGLECGADYFITKPYSESYLILSVEQILLNRRQQGPDRVRVGTEIIVGGKSRLVTTDQQQTLSLLISTYEAAVRTNSELVEAKNELTELNARLEDLVEERTAALREEVRERQQAELLQQLAREVLDLLNRSESAPATIRDILGLVKERTGLTALGLRLREGDDFPFYETLGYSEAFVAVERRLCVPDQAGEILRDERGEAELRCMCGRVLQGRIDPARPCFTAHGCFWTNRLADLPALAPAESGPGSTCSSCLQEGFESIALIPLRSGEGEIIGLLQLHDRQPDRFTPKLIAFLEGFGASIGIALARKAADERIQHLNRVLRAIRKLNKLTASEKDPDRLIHQAGELLVEHRGYESTLILLTDEAGRPRSYAKAGLSRAFQAAPEFLRQEILPPCCLRAGRENGIYHVTDPAEECALCPMAADRPPGDTLCARLRHGERTYGYVAVFMDHLLAVDAENQALFAEMAADLAAALHGIEQEQAVARAAQERERIEAELRQAQKMEAVGRLAGGVAHDFNNMLGVIIGYAEMALEDLSPVDPLHGEIQEIKKAAERSAELTRQLLAFSRKQVVAPKVIDLNRTIAERQKMLARLIGEDIEVKYLPGEGLWSVFLDPSQIDQILANLAVNARDAITDTGTITIETSNVSLDEAYCGRYAQATPGEYVLLSFSDTGVGMDAATMEHIFEPFFTTKKEAGTGLGLSTVFGVVRQYDGFIHTYSEPGLGTTFKIYLPRHLGEAEEPLQREREASLRGTGTILIVEDEAQLLNLARTILVGAGYHVLAARTPGEACRLAEKHEGEIHLLLTDVVMPEMNGKELQAQIVALRPGLKTLFMSGYTANVITHRGVIDKGVEFLNKPFTMTSLTKKVREVLAG